jgi:hypothetical protein
VAAVFGSVRSAGVGFRYYYLRKRFIAISGRSWDFDFAEYLSEKMAEVKAETVLKDIGPPACCSEQLLFRAVACSKFCRLQKSMLDFGVNPKHVLFLQKR